MAESDTHHIVFLERATISPEVTVRAPAFPHTWTDYDRTAPEQIVERARDATILAINKTPITQETVAALPKLKLIAVAATGTDKIDLDACRQAGIPVSNIQGYATTTVPEHTFALILALRRQIVGYREDVKAGEWQKADQFCFFTHPVRDLRGSTLGLIGTGSIGSGVAKLADAFGMKVKVVERPEATVEIGERVELDELLETSDVISIHVPLTPKTKNIIDIAAFRKMKRKPVLVNPSRGGLVDEEALVTALDEGLIAGAGFDVVTTEPPPPDHPFMKLLDRPNFILTPHTAWASREAIQALCDQMIDNIEAFVAGSPRNVVNP